MFTISAKGRTAEAGANACAKRPAFAVTAIVAGAVSVLGMTGSATAATVSAPVLPLGGTDRLSSGMTLRAASSCTIFSCLTSKNGMYEARLQSDGNLVIYQVTSTTKPVWSTRTNGYGTDVWLGNQGDGNLVLYNPNPTRAPRAIWASGSSGRGAADLVMQNDGNLVMYAGGRPTWASGSWSTSPPAPCNTVAPAFFASHYAIEQPYRPYQLNSTVIRGLGRVSSWSAVCGTWMRVTIQRKVCNWTGCNWLDRVSSRKVAVNQRGWTFATVSSNCAPGTNRYRIMTTTYQPTAGDGGPGIWKEQYSVAPEFTC